MTLAIYDPPPEVRRILIGTVLDGNLDGRSASSHPGICVNLC